MKHSKNFCNISMNYLKAGGKNVKKSRFIAMEAVFQLECGVAGQIYAIIS